MFGTDDTGGGIGWQFRQIKADSKLQRDCVKFGGDPQTLGIGSKGEAAGTLRICSSFPYRCTTQPIHITSGILLTWI